MSRCKPSVREKWRKYALKENEDKDRVPNFDDFSKFLKKQAKEATNPLYGEEAFSHAICNALAASSGYAHSQRSTPDYSESDESKRSFASTHSEYERNCLFCHGSHRIYDCAEFKRLSQVDRYRFVLDHGLCFNCLRSGHGVVKCKSSYRCNADHCGRKHHTLIHWDRPSSDSQGERSSPDPVPEQSQVTSHVSRVQVCNALNPSEDIVCLPLASAKVNGSDPFTVLLDPGSTCTLISKRLVDKLKIKSRKQDRYVTLILRTVQGQTEIKTNLVSLEIEALDGSYTHTIKHACVVSDIPARSPRTLLEHRNWSHLDDLQLNEIGPNTQADILIGQDNSDLLVPLEVRSGNPGENGPYAVRTRLGWVLNGVFGRGRCEPGQVFGICNHIDVDKNEEIKEKLDNLWSLEK